MPNLKCLFSLILFFVHQFIFGNAWPYGNVWFIGDSHSVYCFTNYQDRVPWPNHIPEQFPSFYEQSIFHYMMNDDDIIDIPFSIYWLGPRTMYRIGRDGIEGLNIKQIGIQENDVVVFVAGSIDRDCHVVREQDILRQMLHRDMDAIINTLCANYVETILENKRLYKNIKIVVTSVIPVLIQPFMTDIFSEVFPNNSDISILNTEVMIMISRKMNESLKKYCTENNFIFLDIHSLFETNDGDLNKNLCDSHHVNTKYNQPAKEKLISILLKSNTQN